MEFKESKANYYGQSRDISVHGVRFVTAHKLKIRQLVNLNFRFPKGFPGQKELNVAARVVRVYRPQGTERYRVACRLQHPNEHSRETFRQFIAWLQSRK